ncbi:MAG: 3'-5' exonuclease [Candidatus Marinimicrobia bacterium]|nr:3'-5' exonuclease [Candidatus Neomarinimicrobiota bacterium]
MLLKECNITVLDFETTGTVADYPDEPWQLGLVVLEKGIINPQKSLNRYLYIGDRPISPYVPGRHEQLRPLLKKSPRLIELWYEIRPYLEKNILAAHNVGTEKKILRQFFPVHSHRIWIDTLNLSRQVWPGLTKYNLENLLDILNLTESVRTIYPQGHPHDAYYDAVGAALILETILKQPGWDSLTFKQGEKLSRKNK